MNPLPPVCIEFRAPQTSSVQQRISDDQLQLLEMADLQNERFMGGVQLQKRLTPAVPKPVEVLLTFDDLFDPKCTSRGTLNQHVVHEEIVPIESSAGHCDEGRPIEEFSQ